MQTIGKVCVVCVLFALAAVGTQAQKSDGPLDIYFTGKLMGYYRLPNQQTTAMHSCFAPDAAHIASDDAKEFLKDSGRKQRVAGNLLLGMGDNFSPNYYSRVFEPAPSPGSPLKGKELFNWDTLHSNWIPYTDGEVDDLLRTGRGSIPADNVGCFLSYVGYDALVPGKHDFYYGAERLRQLAQFLATPREDSASAAERRQKNETDHFSPVMMLGANLVINTEWANDHKPVPDSEKAKLYYRTKSGNHESWQLGATVFPWVRVFKLQREDDAEGAPPQAILCKAEDTKPDSFLNDQHNACVREVAHMDPLGTAKDVKYRLADVLLLEAGKNYAICVPEPRGPNDPDTSREYCDRFPVNVPMLQWPSGFGADQGPTDPCLDPGKEPSRDGSRIWPLPFLCRHLPESAGSHEKRDVVIFGVVDRDLVQYVGGNNFAWRNVREDGTADKKYNTAVKATDPAEALRAISTYFECEYLRKYREPFHGNRVLLAQMPEEEARQLAAKLQKSVRFDVVIAGPDDLTATPNGQMTIHPLPALWSAADEETGCPQPGQPAAKEGTSLPRARYQPLVVVPPTHDLDPTDLDPTKPCKGQGTCYRALQVRQLQMNQSMAARSFGISGTPDQIAVQRYHQEAEDLWKAIFDAWNRAHPQEKAKDAKEALRNTVLEKMRSNRDADLALLQAHDFYDNAVEDYMSDHGGVTSPLDLQEILDRVIWKGDFLQTRAVKGSVLETVLKESEAYAQAEKTEYLPVNQRGRALVAYGISKDSQKDEYFINGLAVDPDRLYTVAMSDYLWLGDTGYPEFAKLEVGDPPALTYGGTLLYLSGLPCEDLARNLPAHYRATGCNDKELNPQRYYDELAMANPDPRRGNTAAHKLWAWSPFHAKYGQKRQRWCVPRKPKKGDEQKYDSECEAQERVHWMWSLDKASVGFSALTHTGDEHFLSSTFGGVLDPNVNAKRTHSWDFDVENTFTIFHPVYDFFVNQSLQYSSKFVAQNGGSSETQSANVMAFESGVYIHLPQRNMLPRLSWVWAGHLETQPADPLVNLNLKTATPGEKAAVSFHQGRTQFLVERNGFRWDNRQSYIEGGLEFGGTLNAIQSYDVAGAPGGPVLTNCGLKANETLEDCINNFNAGILPPPVKFPIGADAVLMPVRSFQPRYGVYWKMRVVVPLPQKLSYRFEENSDFLFNTHGDNSADTRYRHRLVNTVKFPVFPNLSFEPTYTIFLYENKVNYDSLLQQQFSVKVNYSFEWANRHEAAQQLRYKKPGP